MTSMKRISCIILLLAFISMLVIGCGQQKTSEPAKNAYPQRNINGFISWGAGGVMDNVSRSITPLVEKHLGKSIVLANKPGATGAIATQYVYDQKADGYTLLYHAENPQFYKVLELSKLDYNDFEPIILIGKGVAVIVTYKDSPIHTFDDLVKTIKQNPGKFNMGATGAGGLPQVTTALLMEKEKFKVNFVNYDGEGPLVTALLGKQFDATPISVGTAAQYLKSGDLKAIAVVANSPIDILPGVPALGQLKPEYQSSLKTFGPFYGVFVNQGTPEEAVTKLRDSFAKAYQEDKFQDFMKKSGILPLNITGEEAKQYLKTWQSQHTWLLQSVGATKVSPDKFGIPKPVQ